jgi:hypothetical protein
MSQKKDSLKQIDSAALSIKGWIDIRNVMQTIPTKAKWVHQWNPDKFNRLRTICCRHFDLDWEDPEQRSKCSSFTPYVL